MRTLNNCTRPEHLEELDPREYARLCSYPVPALELVRLRLEINVALVALAKAALGEDYHGPQL